MSLERQFRDKYAGRSPERICCPNSVLLCSADAVSTPSSFFILHCSSSPHSYPVFHQNHTCPSFLHHHRSLPSSPSFSSSSSSSSFISSSPRSNFLFYTPSICPAWWPKGFGGLLVTFWLGANKIKEVASFPPKWGWGSQCVTACSLILTTLLTHVFIFRCDHASLKEVVPVRSSPRPSIHRARWSICLPQIIFEGGKSVNDNPDSNRRWRSCIWCIQMVLISSNFKRFCVIFFPLRRKKGLHEGGYQF